MDNNDEKIMPLIKKLEFLFKEEVICAIPDFLLEILDPENHEKLNGIPDTIVNLREEKDIPSFQKSIPWEKLAPYISCPSYFLDEFRTMWEEKKSQRGSFSLKESKVELPEVIYRYMPYHHERISDLLQNGKLFMPCPAMFNDPFDCSLDDSVKLALIECAIGCFSGQRDNILMFSHYAGSHRGLCVGFNTEALWKSLQSRNPHLDPSLRPVWYFKKLPPLSIENRPALCATCKDEIWSYEREYRIFMENKKNNSWPAPFGDFAFDRNSIAEVIYGCKMEDRVLAECKKLVSDLPECTQFKAIQTPGLFGISLSEICEFGPSKARRVCRVKPAGQQ